jgi:hypothetical protein
MLRAGPKNLTSGFVVRSVRERARDFADVLNSEPAGLSLREIEGLALDVVTAGSYRWMHHAVTRVAHGTAHCIRGCVRGVSGVCLTVSLSFVSPSQGVSRHPFPPPVGGLTIEITQIPVFFGRFAFPVSRLLAGPVSLRHTVPDLEGPLTP